MRVPFEDRWPRRLLAAALFGAMWAAGPFGSAAARADVAALVRQAERAADPETKLQHLDAAVRQAASRREQAFWVVWAMRAEVHVTMRNWAKAESDAGEALRRDRSEWQAWNLRAWSRINLGKLPEALADASEAIRLAPPEAGPRLIRAEAYVRLQRWDEAIEDASQAIRIDRNLVRAWQIRAQAKLLGNDFRGAVSDATDAIQHDRLNDPFGYLLRAEARRLLGEHDQAIQDAGSALDFDAQFLPALFCRARAFLAKGEHADALDDVVRALRGDRQHAEARLLLIEVLVAMRRYDDALRHCEYLDTGLGKPDEARRIRTRIRAIQGQIEGDADAAREAAELDAGNPEQWLSLGRIHRQKKDYRQAIDAFNKALSLQEDCAEAFAERAEAYRILGDYPRAVQDATKALDLRPDSEWALGTRGAAYASMERWDEALKDLGAALEIDPQYYFAREVRTKLHMDLGQLDRAQTDARLLIGCATDDADKSFAYVRLAEVLRYQRLLDEAMAAADEAHRLAPDRAAPYFERAQILQRRQELQLAIEQCNKGLEIAPEEPYGFFVRGVSRSELGRGELAEKDLLQSIEVDRLGAYNAWNHAFLADSARQQGDYDRAIHHASLAVDLRPSMAHPMAYLARGVAHRAQGNLEEAVRDCTAALDRNSRYAFAYAERGAAQRDLGRFDLAISDCSQAISLAPFFHFPYFERAQAELARYRAAEEVLPGQSAEMPALLMDSHAYHRNPLGIGGTAGPGDLAKAADEIVRGDSRTALRLYEPERVLRDEPEQQRLHPLHRAAADFRMLWRTGYEPVASAAGLARCLHEMGRFAEAVEVCRQALIEEGDDAELHLAAAWACYALEQAEQGLEHARGAFAAAEDRTGRAPDSGPRASAGSGLRGEAHLAVAAGHALLRQWQRCRQACQEGLEHELPPALAMRLILLRSVAEAHQETPWPDIRSQMDGLAASQNPSPDNWPEPLVRALADDETLDRFGIPQPEDDSDYVARRRRCQTFYQFAIRDLSAGRLVQARAKLRHALESGVRQQIEFALAEASLRHLGG